MKYLKRLTHSELSKILNPRPKEIKFGEQIVLLSNSTPIYDQLLNLDVGYVIFGIKEAVGVFANCGNHGTENAWDAAIKVLVNTQANPHTHANKVLILGCLEFEAFQEKINTLDQSNKKDLKKARKIVQKIDAEVTFLMHQIVSAGKIPIVIGGGHNNAYGNIKGTSLALKKPINVINFDAHHDFRDEEGRHSGNGFSYAFAEGFLKRYFIFGMHENYVSDTILNTLKKLKNIQYNTFEAIAIRKTLDLKHEMNAALEHLGDAAFGLEIDCDAIKNTPSSAKTPSGFSAEQARQFVDFFGSCENASYLHICEAAPTKETETQVGKLITYLISDFIRAHAND
ncbi:formimidoylglutamase [Subsaximicrobium wynnwilliamsii]|uniref:Formimidoylglutamase n=2 Tax=Subsaximicrobium wynnwilliamsii TaxID=291179 RepID=A0A5C6ZF66_9FLAO|nr:formimidoylglutamase [Subsaximicrobium wynnwilliamsii]TXD82955.1 formimidoylglutamase [Subsaximicrobium wynnwilliamsii]TXD88676.1 formimidoylglutamase [Subsaximicrobium wynnwilliamsii]TXE02769.1 formimidoylglutamase [Subsaximicrobium wynnwilliamsii]